MKIERFEDKDVYEQDRRIRAAGHVKVPTIGGVVTGLRGALGVVEAILNGGSSRQLQALRRELDRSGLIRRVLHGFTQADYSRLLDMLTASTKRCLGLFPRDETSKLLFHLLLKQPRLLLLGLRALLGSGPSASLCLSGGRVYPG